jgi:ubiquinone/menaquinone biosynthesis C-methylase UbiE
VKDILRLLENFIDKEFVRWKDYVNRNFSLLYSDYIKKQALFFSIMFANELNNCSIILELGAGLGLVSLLEAMRGNHVVILDCDKEVIKQSFQQVVNLEVADNAVHIIGDIFNMPFSDNSFDKNKGVLEHFENMKSAIKEMRRVCKVNGKILILVPNKYAVHTYLIRPFRRLLKNFSPDIWGRECSYSPDDLKRIMENCGIKVLKSGTFNLARSLFDDYFCGFLGRIPFLQRKIISIRNFVDKTFSNSVILGSFGFITYCLGEKVDETWNR